jgi:hypothetical protein
MNLSQARNYFSPHIEQGRCRETAVVRDVINEAQRRLYALDNWLGLVFRWGVTVDDAGEFDSPADADVIMRISELPEGMPHTPTGTVVASGANAFVFDSPSILRFTQIRPGRYRILGPYPHAVDIMGKIKYKDAIGENDPLIVTDREAMKLMVQALWRESNDSPDLANDLIAKAVAHLQSQRTTAVESAKMALYQNQLLSSPPGTRGYVRAKVAETLTGGERMDDARVASLTDDAEKRLMSQVSLWASYLCRAIGPYFSLPREIESILRVTVDNRPATTTGPTHEFMEYGIGYREGGHSGNQVIYRGEHALQADLPRRSRVTVYAGGRNRGIHINITGRLDGVTLSEVLVVDGGNVGSTRNEYDEILSIMAPPRDGELSFVVDATEVALMQPYETDSKRARYSVPECGSSCEPKTLRVMGRPRWLPKIRDEQRMQVENDQAVTLMAAAITLERTGEIEKAQLLSAQAVGLLEGELLLRNMGHSSKLSFTRTPGLPLRKRKFGR